MPAPERVLAVIDTLGPGGAEHALLTLLPALQRRGHECLLVALGPPYDLVPEFESRGVEVRRLEAESLHSLAVVCARLARLIHSFTPSVVHAHLFLAELSVAMTRGVGPHALRLVTFHNLAYFSYPPSTLRRRLRRALDRVAVSRGMDGRIAVSHAVQSHYAQSLGLGSTVIHNGVDPEEVQNAEAVDARTTRAQFGVSSQGKMLLCAGRFRHEKGHRFLIEAVGRLKQRGLGPRLVLAGTGPLTADVVAEVRKRNLGDEVQFVGHLDHAQLMRVMAAADIVVVPSTYEGLSVTAEEALMLGKPVVASRVGGLPEVVEDGRTGLLVPPADPTALADSLQKLLTDRSLRERLGNHGRGRAAQLFTATRAAIAHERLFADIRGSASAISRL